MSVEFLSALGAAVRAMRARLDRELQTHGLHVGQHMILRVLWDEDGLTPREIADRVGVEMPTVTRAVQRMERGGFLSRTAHPDDARSVRIHLTERGRAVWSEVSQLLVRETERALHGIPADQSDAMTALLEQVATNLRTPDSTA
ncbi:MAG: MarR family winged helix-turn-helix transcriptional regulator [Vulcanimicrobiaceae bacterium]